MQSTVALIGQDAIKWMGWVRCDNYLAHGNELFLATDIFGIYKEAVCYKERKYNVMS